MHSKGQLIALEVALAMCALFAIPCLPKGSGLLTVLAFLAAAIGLAARAVGRTMALHASDADPLLRDARSAARPWHHTPAWPRHLELAIAVGLVLTLTVVAVWGVRQYIANGKLAEARESSKSQ